MKAATSLPFSKQLVLRGQITPGRGLAKNHMSNASEEMHRLLGEHFYNGTLNVILNRPKRLREDLAVKTAEGRMFWPATIEGVRVWLYRWADAPLHSAELVSSFNLKDRLHVKDGDNIVLKLDAKYAEEIRLSERIMWEIFWRGRRTWYYVKYPYYLGTGYAARRLGATQRRQDDAPYEVVFTFLKKRVLKAFNVSCDA